MILLTAFFYYLAAGSIVCALLAVTRRNTVHSMLWVLTLFLHVAGIFLLLQAEFLAAVQAIVYAGAILIFYLFVLMLLDLPEQESGPRFSRHWPYAAAGGLCFGALALVVRVGMIAPAGSGSTHGTVGSAAGAVPQGNIETIGMTLFGPFALPFEIASLLLLAAIVGGVVLAKKRGLPS
jgi:NADH-quinone oxidoreductase subunit J